MNEKQMVGEKAVEYIKDGMVVGLGTGSTIFYTIKKLGELVRGGLKIKGVPTSEQTAALAKEEGIPLVDLKEVKALDVAIDGADQVDSDMNLIKGGGGALLREKIIANAASSFIVIADSAKLADKLGTFPLPVEVVQFGVEMTAGKIETLRCIPKLRQKEGQPFITDNGNYILDCDFKRIESPAELEVKLNMIPGVVENGLFVNYASKLITIKNGELSETEQN
ncbi:ribose-5-phosphate isomerase RpiA [Bacillus sp. ISL-35]|uniref:ribose-5-phosphate isomerase RpiA n=1 Tax=Bacillus sp. ISL-35 TaxID=2819122 RepID=UPI001BE5A71A|nr:ribose-5-phosphate isomerase RpiA [Bacillus sp. ISL-35]MBT2681979.1 ribose-5-phosphate isomerase RpiA [Bacillus sp. ISL-35]MBT2706137.1 ribose-5-phosphate isomerase RpiA [Chryseobacterium sp. ISL-80]